MSKVDFFTLSRPDLISETKTFRDPRFKGDKSKAITLTLRALDEVQRAAVQRLQQERMLYYCGDAEQKIAPASDFPLLSAGGPPIELNRTLAYQAASLTVMQTTEQPERYSFEELIAMALTCPVVWKNVLRWRDSVNRRGEKQTEALEWGADYWPHIDTAINNFQAHPEIVAYVCETLRSLNARVHALITVLGGDTTAGADLPILGTRWLEDIRMWGVRKARAQEQTPADETRE